MEGPGFGCINVAVSCWASKQYCQITDTITLLQTQVSVLMVNETKITSENALNGNYFGTERNSE